MLRRFLIAAFLMAASSIQSMVRADNAQWIGSQPTVPAAESRAGGVLAQSYGYHRQSAATGSVPAAMAAQSGGWYGYGFPVQTYRWGWFGATHYYPTVLWHQSYSGEECRWGYRCGY